MKQLILLLLVSWQVLADDPSLGDRRGIWIKPQIEPSNQLVLPENQPYTVKGSYCLVKIQDFGSTRCERINDNQIDVSTFFPDELTEVTDQTNIDQDRRNFNYTYTTPPLKKDEANSFTMIVGTLGQKTRAYNKVLAKIKKIIAFLEDRRASYLDHHHPYYKYKEKYIAYLDQMIARFKMSRDRLEKLIDHSPDVLARYTLPLQVKNSTATKQVVSAIFNGMRLAYIVNKGVHFDGEPNSMTLTVTNLTGLNFALPALDGFFDRGYDRDPRGTPYQLQLRVSNHTVFTQDIDKIDLGEELSFNVDLDKISSADSNNVELALYRKWPWPYSYFRSPIAQLKGDLLVADDTTAPQWVLGQYNSSITCLQNLTNFNLKAKDDLGIIDPASFEIKINNVDATNQFQIINQDQGRLYDLAWIERELAEGVYDFQLKSKDYAGNFTQPNPLNFRFQIDRTRPDVRIAQVGNILTNNPSFALDMEVIDASPVSTAILLNGVEVQRFTEKVISTNITLHEGTNEITIVSIDAAGNNSGTYKLSNIKVDTVPPLLSDINPASGSTVFDLGINLNASSSEALSKMVINDEVINLNGASAINQMVNAVREGNFDINLVVYDLAGNTSSYTLSYNIILKVVRGELISLRPHNGKIEVIGLPGAAMPGAVVDISGGFFNSTEVIANADGSFSAFINYTTDVVIDGKISGTNREDTVALKYNADTTLSGIVKDIDNNPLPGATVTIISSGQSATTDVSGLFKIPKPITGDQEIVIDGTTISDTITGTTKEFSKQHMKLSIGNLQQNVLSRAIYMTPLIKDGTETTVPSNQNIVATSPHAPGVEIHIAAGDVIFPDGQASGTINMKEISKEVTSIPVPDFAEPDTVIALEPSGLKFRTPTKLVLPNVNEFPAGMEVVIMSKNSSNGKWEINGAATVTGDGNSIVTKDGLGITHFSEVFAAPYGLDIATPSSADVIGADTFNGGMSNAITLPAVKTLGHGLSTTIYYNSRWANPNAVVKNTFNIPKKIMEYQQLSTVQSIYGKVIVNDNIQSWVVPEWIDAWFTIGGTSTSSVRFTGLPEQSTISYAVDLSTMPSGVYPYQANYEIKLRQMSIRTRGINIISNESLMNQFQLPEAATSYEKLLDDVYPRAVPGRSFVQNKINSEAGRGMKIGITKQIVNPNSDFIMLEGNDGGISTYGISNNVETLVYDADGMKGFDLNSWPNLSYMKSSSTDIYTWSDGAQQATNVGSIRNYQGIYAVNFVYKTSGWSNYSNTVIGGPLRCMKRKYNYSFPRQIYSTLNVGGNNFIATDSLGSVVKTSAGSLTSLIGGYPEGGQELIESFAAYEGAPVWVQHCFQSFPGMDCNNLQEVYNGDFDIMGQIYPTNSVQTPIQEVMCDIPAGPTDVVSPSGLVMVRGQCLSGNCQLGLLKSSGEYFHSGFADGDFSTSMLNDPHMVIPGLGDNTLLVADTGNNRVRLMDLTGQVISTFAGNGQTYDNGDGGFATDASLYHPRGLARDNQGNIYISTENGYIRKVDSSGRITTIAGKTLSNGGTLDMVTTLDQVNLSSPTGLAYDEVNNFLYVADTGHNRIIKLDLNLGSARQVAGNMTCNGSLGDGGPALGATFCQPEHIGLDNHQNLIVADAQYKRIRRVNFFKSDNGITKFTSSQPDGSSLTREADGTFTLAFRNGTKNYFDVTGRQTSSRDRVGRTTSYQYNNGLLTRAIDPVGKETELIYNGSGLLSRIVDPTGRETRFNYDGNLLVGATFPDGTTRSFSYNDKGMMTAETNQRGVVTNYQYNKWDRLQKVSVDGQTQSTINDADSKTISNDYTPSSGNNGNLANNAKVYDGIVDAKNVETAFAKDGSGYVATITDGEGKITTIQRNFSGKPIKIIHPDGSYVTFTYDATTWDLTSKFDSKSNSTQSYQYDSYGNLLSYTNPRGYTSINTYDPMTGLLLSSKDALNNTSSKVYGSYGLVSSQSNALGQTASFEYDSKGNLSKSTSNGGKVTTYVRDDAGNVISTTNNKNQTTYYQYDVMNRLISVTTPKGLKTEYSYLPTGELAQIKDPAGNLTKFEYDVMGRLVKKTDPLGYINTLSYDANGNVEREIDPNGNIKTYTYDVLNRLTRKTLPDNIYQMSYDVRGNIVQLSDNDSSLIYSYTHVGDNDLVSDVQISGTNLPSVTLSYDYDANGNRIARHDPSGTTAYVYNQIDNLNALTNQQNRAYDFGIDAIGRITDINGPVVINHFNFDADNMLSSMITKNRGNTALSTFGFTRDQIGNILNKTGDTYQSGYLYDDDNQLIAATNTELTDSYSNEAFYYDELANRVQDQRKSYFFDLKKQRLEEDSSYTYVYDANGNLLSKQEKGMTGNVVNYSYSSENQLIQIDTYVNNIITKRSVYTYDALGRRSSKVVTDYQDSSKSLTRRYILDGDEIILEYDGSNSILASYTQSGLRTDDTLSVNITAAGEAVGLAPSRGSYHFVKDQLGSIVSIANDSGAIVQRYTYSSFGKLLKITDAAGMDSTSNPDIKTTYTYTNREYDAESGLYYYRARYYDSAIGRFTTSDPDPGSLMSPMTFNTRYAYAGNNGINNTDPSGLRFHVSVGGVGFSASASNDSIKQAVIMAAVITASMIVGPEAGLLFEGTFASVAAGAVAGAVVGGVVGGLTTEALGQGSFRDGFRSGAIMGAMAGGFSAYGAEMEISAAGEGGAAEESIAATGERRIANAWYCMAAFTVLSAITYNYVFKPVIMKKFNQNKPNENKNPEGQTQTKESQKTAPKQGNSSGNSCAENAA